MKYLGGKFRIKKPLAQLLNKVIEDNKVEKYIEPFCGACNITTEINPNITRIACDLHEDLILLWKKLQNGWIPPENVSEQEYKEIRNAPPSALRGFIGFGCSWGGKWFGGYARNYVGEFNPNSNRAQFLAGESKRSLLKKIKKLQNVYFKNCSYSDIPIDKLENRLIYADIPYFGTTIYNGVEKFNHEHFWQWCRQASIKNHVYISEYQAPPDFEVVLEIQTRTDLRNKDNELEPRIERLFKWKG